MDENSIDRYLITHEYTCPECKGDGYTDSPEWAAFGVWGSSLDHKPSDGLVAEWWTNHGYSCTAINWWNVTPSDQLPCSECEGTGIIREKVSLVDAINAIQGKLKPALPNMVFGTKE